jgi:hypothetical protein
MQATNRTNEDLCSEMHPDLVNALQILYQPDGFIMMNVIREAESRDYGASTFKLNDMNVVFRAAHITPTKIGQFVTLWKREGHGPIQPYDENDPIDLFVVSVRSGERWGQFVFPKQLLIEQDVVSQGDKGGKRALRVYPPWDVTESRQAEKSQLWQGKYFLDLSDYAAIDRERVKKLYGV